MAPLVETSYGKLRGTEERGVTVFRGIPFARPPVGPLRFRAPERPAGWAGSQTLYDGSALARRGDVVVVTINYRLGALGFLRLRELDGDDSAASGNEGLLDQIAALEWVRDQIA